MSGLDEPVTVVDHRAEWASQGEAEAARIARALGLAASDLEHIGSSAVAGLAARPTIDLMIGAIDYPAPALQSALVALGYEWLGEAGVPGRSYFRTRGSFPREAVGSLTPPVQTCAAIAKPNRGWSGAG
jgi:GrpB-like predicted nucleotidyltransferase (UPF0157 family)